MDNMAKIKTGEVTVDDNDADRQGTPMTRSFILVAFWKLTT